MRNVSKSWGLLRNEAFETGLVVKRDKWQILRSKNWFRESGLERNVSSGRCCPGCWHVWGGLVRRRAPPRTLKWQRGCSSADAADLRLFPPSRRIWRPRPLGADVTAPAQSEPEPRRASERPERAGFMWARFYRPFPPFNPGPLRGHEGAAAVLPGALPPGEPEIQDSRRGRSSGRVLRGPEQLEGTDPPFGFCIFNDEDHVTVARQVVPRCY